MHSRRLAIMWIIKNAYYAKLNENWLNINTKISIIIECTEEESNHEAIIGTVTVVGCLLGGYLPHGSIGILIQPLELLIICGGAFGAYVIATPGWAIKKGIGDAVGLIKPSPLIKRRTNSC